MGLDPTEFRFTEFTELDANLKKNYTSYGYRIFNEFGMGYNNSLTIEQLRDMTPEVALNYIKEEHPDFMDAVYFDGGFEFNGQWVEVDRKAD